MIFTKKDLKETLNADYAHDRQIGGKKMWLEFLKGNMQVWWKYRFLKNLRYIEFCQNNRNSLWGKIRYVLANHIFQNLQIKTNLFISPNVFGPGLNIEHLGFIRADSVAKIGKNCTILPRVLLGKKKPSVPLGSITIGDNAYLGSGCTILGPVNIGNNVIVAAGAVVINDVPDNCMVAGNPACIKKRNILPILD
jgi:serine O-acetyltransferase